MADFKSFFNSSIRCSIVGQSYASICHRFCFTKLLSLILVSLFSGILLSYYKNISNNVLMIKSHIKSVTYLRNTWNFLEYIWLVSRNPRPKLSFSSRALKI